jgi:hypothetical protein
MVDELEKESEVHSKITFESVEGEFSIAEAVKYLITDYEKITIIRAND